MCGQYADGWKDGIKQEKARAFEELKASTDRLRGCALGSCAAREAPFSHFPKCSACKTVVYCCKEHQVADWPAHKAVCKAARKAGDGKAA